MPRRSLCRRETKATGHEESPPDHESYVALAAEEEGAPSTWSTRNHQAIMDVGSAGGGDPRRDGIADVVGLTRGRTDALALAGLLSAMSA